jgi:hypothetical protein
VASEAVNITPGLHGKPVCDGFTLWRECEVCRPPPMRVPPIPSPDEPAALEPLHGSGARGTFRGRPVRIASTGPPQNAQAGEFGPSLVCSIQLDPQGDLLDGSEDSLLQRTQAQHAVCVPMQFHVLFHVILWRNASLSLLLDYRPDEATGS